MLGGDSRQLTTFEKIFNVGFNVRYSVIGFFDAISLQSVGQPGDLIHFLGKEVEVHGYNQEEQNEALSKLFQSTPWLTYRSGFPQLYH